MNIGMLGYESNNSFTPLMAAELNAQGHFVTHFSINKVKMGIGPLKMDDYLQFKEPFPLSAAIKGHEDRIDFLIVAQSFMTFKNDLKMPVVYFHTELTSPIRVLTPTHLAMKNPEMERWMKSYHPWEWHKINHKFMLYPAAHPPHYNPDAEKDIHISFVGAPSDMFDRERDWVWNMMQEDMNKIIKYMRLRNIGQVFDDMGETPATHPDYHVTLTRSQHMILLSHKGVYIGRRAFECLASKTIPIIWIENDYAQQVFENLGFRGSGPKQNCYFFRKKYELDKFKKVKYDPKIAQRGYDLLLSNHTFGHRALTLMKHMEMTLKGWRSIPLPTQPEAWEEDFHLREAIPEK